MSEKFDLVAHLERQRAFSAKTFGPGARTKGVLDHIRKELAEIEADPSDIREWVDVIILAFDGAWRAGWEPELIVNAIVAKQTKNEGRVWPDWRTADPNKAIEHDRSHDAAPSAPASPTVEAIARDVYKRISGFCPPTLLCEKSAALCACRDHWKEIAGALAQARAKALEDAAARVDRMGDESPDEWDIIRIKAAILQLKDRP